MVRLRRFDVAVHNDAAMVVVESELLPPAPSIVVIPLIAGYPAVTLLNPVIRFNDRDLVLATRLITSVRRSALSRAGCVDGQADAITRALDVLTGGV